MILILIAAAGGGAALGHISHPEVINGSQIISGQSALPFDSLQNWTDYADAVVDAQVTSEAGADLTAEELEAGEGLQVRLVTLTVVDTIWTNSLKRKIPSTFTTPHGGWLYHNGKLGKRMYLEHSVDLVPNEHYLIPLTFDAKARYPWQAISPEAIVPFAQAVAGRGEQPSLPSDKASSIPAATKLAGLGRASIAKALAATPPRPVAQDKIQLPALERYKAVLQEEARPRPARDPNEKP